MLSVFFLLLMAIPGIISDHRILRDKSCLSEGVFCLDVSKDGDYSLDETMTRKPILMSLTVKRVHSDPFLHRWYFWFNRTEPNFGLVNVTFKAENKSMITNMFPVTTGVAIVFNGVIDNSTTDKMIHEMKLDDQTANFTTNSLFEEMMALETARQQIKVEIGNSLYRLGVMVWVRNPHFLFGEKKAASRPKTEKPESVAPSRKLVLVASLIVVAIVAAFVFVFLVVYAVRSRSKSGRRPKVKTVSTLLTVPSTVAN